jgi:hypothetical protein
MLSEHLVAGLMWMASTATALMVTSRLSLALRETSYSSPISGSGLPNLMAGTLKPTFFSFFLAAYSLVITDWLLPPSHLRLAIFTRYHSWNTWVPGG